MRRKRIKIHRTFVNIELPHCSSDTLCFIGRKLKKIKLRIIVEAVNEPLLCLTITFKNDNHSIIFYSNHNIRVFSIKII